ncbi:unnamed protein product, partial [Phaeothamnion confervicola]
LVVDEAVTVAGFEKFHEIFLEDGQVAFPWQVLRHYGYDDKLLLSALPEHVAEPPLLRDGEAPELSAAAVSWLAALFRQFDADGDGTLTGADLGAVFAAAPDPAVAPWDPPRAEAFCGCDAQPAAAAFAAAPPPPPPPSSDGGGAIGGVDDGDAGGVGSTGAKAEANGPGDATAGAAGRPAAAAPAATATAGPAAGLGLVEWIARWQMVATLCPEVAQEALFHLGFYAHVDGAAAVVGSTLTRCKPRSYSSRRQAGKRAGGGGGGAGAGRRHVVHTLVLGADGCGRTAACAAAVAAARAAAGAPAADAAAEPPEPRSVHDTRTPHSFAAAVSRQSSAAVSFHAAASVGDEDDRGGGDACERYVVLTDVPEGSTDDALRTLVPQCDVVVLTFDGAKPASVDFALDMERALPKDVPRFFATVGEDSAAAAVPAATAAPGTAALAATAAAWRVAQRCDEEGLRQPVVLCRGGSRGGLADAAAAAAGAMVASSERGAKESGSGGGGGLGEGYLPRTDSQDRVVAAKNNGWVYAAAAAAVVGLLAFAAWHYSSGASESCGRGAGGPVGSCTAGRDGAGTIPWARKLLPLERGAAAAVMVPSVLAASSL